MQLRIPLIQFWHWKLGDYYVWLVSNSDFLYTLIISCSCSRKYAAHCSMIAARYSLPPFNHPSAVPISGGGRNGRLRVG